ncbi:unnamed protein product [Ceutorhynchus assimilis]|uniref:Myb-like domain-containing protein n=1 Tax=Ceutorhynchus assimilis TaxID=467358 RepID=A0A9N9MDV6_9CUCU|nr:unnamed protein product [Ceutorhynchus assimilis]
MNDQPADDEPDARRKLLKSKVNPNYKNTRINVVVGKTEIYKETPIMTEHSNSTINHLILVDANDLRNNDHLDSSITENKMGLKLNKNEPTEMKAIIRRKLLKPKVKLNLKKKTRNVTDSGSKFAEVPIITEVQSPSEIEFKLEDSTDHSTITTENETISELNKPIEVKPIARRKFLNPQVNLNFKNNVGNVVVGESSIYKEISTTGKIPSFTREIESNTLKDLNESIDKQKATKKIIILSDIRMFLPTRLDKVAKINSETANNATVPNADVMLNKAQYNSDEVSQKENPTVISSPHRRCISESQVADSEHPAPSPSKLLRHHTETIAKLSIGTASCSASESEDGSQKYERINNNSVLVSSVASTSIPLNPAPQARYQMSPKKLIETKQLKKLAGTERNVQKSFGVKTCGKRKLRMVDLIYYNSEANPMSQQKPKDSKSKINKFNDEKQVDVRNEGHNEDGTDNNFGPQIKICPSGEIVLDEQSLVVENAKLAKQIEEISNSSIVDGDLNRGYGVYDRAKRATNWTEKETSKFYKALNLLGTDFTTMTDLFPRRNRRQLKDKFKREEKTNLHLIDQALREPCTFTYSDFKRELRIEEEEGAVLTKIRNEENERRKQRKLENLKPKAIEDKQIIKSKEALENSNKISIPETKAKKSKANQEKKPLTIYSVLDSEED